MVRQACLSCKKRKSRCKVETEESSKCLMCRVHDTECVFTSSIREIRRRSRIAAQTRRTSSTSSPVLSASRDSGAPHQTPAYDGATSRPTPAVQSLETPFADAADFLPPEECEPHIVGPTLASDAEWIANYLSSDANDPCMSGRSIGFFPGPPALSQKPTMFRAVRKRPLGTGKNLTDASSRCEFIERLLEPHEFESINLYFEKVHPAFPILDRDSFLNQYTAERSKLSPALLSNMYAQSIVFWKCTRNLSKQHCPNVRFMWNQATMALYSELHMSPGLSTIIAILLNISGRPLSSMLGNGVLLSSAIALAHSLGLNRDCSDWNMSQAEKSLRVRIWWAIVLYDKWSSIAYGTPPHIRKTYCDVPILSVENFGGQMPVHGDADSISTYIALVKLTELLDTCLDHVFCLAPVASRSYTNLGDELAAWEDSMPNEVRRMILRGVNLTAKGSANLRLAYLYLRLLSRKSEADIGKGHLPPAAKEVRAVRRAAEDVVSFIQELHESSLSDFWLPLHGFVLSSTMAYLLRSAIEEDVARLGLAQNASFKLAEALLEALKSHKKRASWDLGDVSITQFSEIIAKLAVATEQVNALTDAEMAWLSGAVDSPGAFWEFPDDQADV